MKVLPQIDSSKSKRVDLDVKDKKILHYLSGDARAPLSEIAKKVKLSRDSVQYRLNSLESKGVLKKTRTVVNTSKLGYESYHIFLRLNNPKEEIERKFIQSIKDLPFVRAIIKVYGSYDFEIALIAKGIQEFDNIINLIIEKAGDNLRDYEIIILTNNYVSRSFPKNFIKEDKNQDFIKKKHKVIESNKIDSKDIEIIKVIRDDARIPLIDISKKVKLSPDAVSYRLKNLYGNFIISYIPTINYNSIGYSINIVLLNLIPLNKENEKKLADFLNSNSNILWASKSIGKYNTIIYTCTRYDSYLQSTISELRSLFPKNIINYDSFLAAVEYKYTYAPDCLFK